MTAAMPVLAAGDDVHGHRCLLQQQLGRRLAPGCTELLTFAGATVLCRDRHGAGCMRSACADAAWCTR